MAILTIAWHLWRVLRTAASLSIPVWSFVGPGSFLYLFGHILLSHLMRQMMWMACDEGSGRPAESPGLCNSHCQYSLLELGY